MSAHFILFKNNHILVDKGLGFFQGSRGMERRSVNTVYSLQRELCGFLSLQRTAGPLVNVGDFRAEHSSVTYKLYNIRKSG